MIDGDRGQPALVHPDPKRARAVERWVTATLAREGRSAALSWGATLHGPDGEAWVQRLRSRPQPEADNWADLRAGEAGGEAGWVVKLHHQPAGYHAERRAYAHLAAPLRPSLPTLQAHDDATRGLLLRESPGIPVDQLCDPNELLRAHEAAGRFLAALQAVPLPELDPMPAEEAIARRLRGWLRRARRVTTADNLATQTRAEVRAAMAAAAREVTPEAFVGARRVWAHRDFRPGNWLWERATARLTVLDLGHARADVAEADWVKLAADAWPAAARRAAVEPGALQAAFSAGFQAAGGSRATMAAARQRSLIALHRLATVVWGR